MTAFLSAVSSWRADGERCGTVGEQDIHAKQDEYAEALGIAKRVADAHMARLGPVRGEALACGRVVRFFSCFVLVGE